MTSRNYSLIEPKLYKIPIFINPLCETLTLNLNQHEDVFYLKSIIKITASHTDHPKTVDLPIDR